MAHGKHRNKHNAHKKSDSLVNMLRSIKEQKTRKENYHEIKHTYNLTDVDRITYIYQLDSKSRIIEITCVSYDLCVNNQWHTLVYYDNYHGGILHRHTKLSLEKNIDIPNVYGVKKKGTSKELLSWANNDLRKNYLNYRKGFIRKNKKYLNDNNIDI
jgi:hypothetical protein